MQADISSLRLMLFWLFIPFEFRYLIRCEFLEVLDQIWQETPTEAYKAYILEYSQPYHRFNRGNTNWNTTFKSSKIDIFHSNGYQMFQRNITFISSVLFIILFCSISNIPTNKSHIAFQNSYHTFPISIPDSYLLI